MIGAKVICDSVSTEGHRMTTFELRYPKFIHGEAKTHRVMNVGNEGGYELIQEVGFMDDDNLSRNASSSRAIPTHKLLEEVRSDDLRAGPVEWGKNMPGMQAKELLLGEDLEAVMNLWKHAALCAADIAEQMLARNAHKQIVNRILEPFSHINVVCTATEYANFFGLRLHADAQPEARVLANCMWHARERSVPEKLELGLWHLPYVNQEDINAAAKLSVSRTAEFWDTLIKISVARCARVSYRSFETGKPSTFEEDVKLHDRLLGAQPLHASPAEHQATPDQMTSDERPSMTSDWPGGWVHPNEHGNLVGWRQYRKMLPNEAVAPLPEGYIYHHSV